MTDGSRFYIDGQWVDPVHPGDEIVVVNPATEEEAARVAAASSADVDSAVQAAHRAFASYSQTSREERIEYLTRLREAYKRRIPAIAAAMTTEVGIPRGLAEGGQVLAGARHLKEAMEALRDYPLAEDWGSTRIVREPVGVCALLAPWNWPMNQVTAKVGPALAAGCTMVLKPSQLSPLSALLFAEAADEAGLPPGVFNMVNGAGAALGDAFSTHPLVDMVSITGSTAVGGSVAAAAAPTIKRVSQELGGKSANIVFGDVNVEKVVASGTLGCMHNSGQTCNAPTRMLVAQEIYDEAVEVAARTAEAVAVGDPQDQTTVHGPRRRAQAVRDRAPLHRDRHLGGRSAGRRRARAPRWPRQGLLRAAHGLRRRGAGHAHLPGRDLRAGPLHHAVPRRGACDRAGQRHAFGLSGYVQSADVERARRVAGRMRTGMVHLNGAPTDGRAPFGGYRQSGNGREWGRFGLEDFLEVKAVMGWEPRGR